MKQKVKIIGLLAFSIVIMVSLFTQAQSANPQETLNQYIADLQKNPNDNSLREKIIKFVRTMKPVPEISEEARRHFVRGNTALQDAKDSTDYDRAIARYNDALLISPWWADPYFNLAKALELKERYDDAIASLKLYLLAAPNAEDARTAQDMIYALEDKKEKTEKQRSEEIKNEQVLDSYAGDWISGESCWHTFRFIKTGADTFTFKYVFYGGNCEYSNLSYYNHVYEGSWKDGFLKGTVVNSGIHGSYQWDCSARFTGVVSEDGKTIQIKGEAWKGKNCEGTATENTFQKR